MHSWVETILLGVIEGITEFLPISSTGHLILAQFFLGEPRSEFFNIGIQAGAMLAVILIYWRRLLDLAVHWRQPEQFAYWTKCTGAFFVTAGLGLGVKKLGFTLPEDPWPVTWAVLVGAFVIFGVERWARGRSLQDSISWPVALGIGAAQVLAGVFPGASRSGTTIMAAMAMGTSRLAATEFSFLLGIPTMFAATAYAGYEFYKEHGGFPKDEMDEFWIGFVVSTVVAFIAVKWLLVFIRSHTFVPFAWYRLGLGLFLVGYLLWVGA
ncbi:MAG: undecaprenyl-diphosphate phosphatase [Candidatus Methylacidiphilales bacterium]